MKNRGAVMCFHSSVLRTDCSSMRLLAGWACLCKLFERGGGAAAVAMRDNGVLLTALPFRRERESERERERGREERERQRERVQIEGGRQEGPPPYSGRSLANIVSSGLEAFVVCYFEGQEIRSQGIIYHDHASNSATRGGDRVGALLEAAWTLVTRG